MNASKHIGSWTLIAWLLCALSAQSQQSGIVPRLIKFTGQVNARITQTAQPKESESASSTAPQAVSLAFSLYELQDGGGPLWSESQKVQLDGQGRYTVLLGATEAGGLPLDIFTSGKALWLGVQPQLPGATEQPRVLLVAVPYALKASDADTLGGKPASAYALAGAPLVTSSAAQPLATSLAGVGPTPDSRFPTPASQPQAPTACSSVTSDGTATANYLAKFTSACNIQTSLLFDNGTKVGVGTNAPVAFLDTQSTPTATASGFNYGLRALTTANPASTSAASFFSLYANTQTQTGNTQNFFNLYGTDSRVDHYGTGTVSGAYGEFAAVLNHAGGTINNAYGLYTYLSNGSTGKIGNAYGLYLAAPLNGGGGTFSNYTGVYIANPTAVVPNAFGVYSGGGTNYFNGNVGIGTTTPAAKLEVNGASQFDLGVTFHQPVTFAAGQTFPLPNLSVTNSMLQHSSVTINTGSGLSGGGQVALGSTLSLSNTGVLSVGTTSGSGILVGGTAANPLLSADPSVLATNSSVTSAVAGGVTTAESFATSAVTAASNAIKGSALTLNTTSPISGGPVTFNPGTNTSVTLGLNTSALDSVLNGTYAQLAAANTFAMAQTLGGGAALPATGTATSGTPHNSNPLDFLASSWNGSTAVNERFRWQAEGNGSVDTGTLNLLSATGTNSLGETGLSIASNGQITFASGQAFPPGASGLGTITGVTAGTGLTGGGTSGVVTLSVNQATVAFQSDLTAAENTLNTAISTAQTTAENFATAAANSAQNNAENYANSTFLPLSGGTLTGTLTGTAANFSGTGSFGAGSFSNLLTASGGALLPATGAATSGVPASSNALNLQASSWNGSQSVTEQFTWKAEGNGSADTGTLNLLSATGATSLGETGLSIASNGRITFAPGQTFPSNVGTVTSITAGTGLLGGTITSSGTLSADESVVAFQSDLASGINSAETFATGAANTAQNNAESYASSTFLPLAGGTLTGGLTGTTGTFSGNLSTTGGNLNLSATTGASAGVINLGGVPTLHNCCSTSSSFTNIFVGGYAGNLTTTTGIGNAGVGFGALFSNTTGQENAGFGNNALNNNTTGSYNAALGDHTLNNNTTGSYNAAVGSHALAANTTGVGNTGVGYQTGNGLSSGSNSTFLGYAATATADGLTNATAIGYNAQVGESNALVLGNGSVNVGIGTSTPQYALDVQGTGNFTGVVNFASAVTFAAGQTFPGTGTVTSITANNGLTGGTITTSGSVGIAASGVQDTMLANSYSGVGSCSVASLRGRAPQAPLANLYVTALSRNTGPTCTALPTANGGTAGIVALVGDVTGSSGALTVTGLQTIPVSSTAPSTNQVLTYNGTQWAPAAPSGGSGGGPSIYGDGSDGALTISNSTNWTTNPPGGSLQFTNFTVNAGKTLTVPSGLIIRATASVSISGNIAVVGSPGANGIIFIKGIAQSPPSTVSPGTAYSALQLSQILKPGPDGGSTGSIGDTGGGTNPVGGGGGGTLVILAAGSISIAGSASITASGVAGTGGAIYGAGGGGGGVIILASKSSITNSGTIAANGGSGANGAPTTSGCVSDGYSAGGGGGGGLVHLLAPSITAGSITVNGGAAGGSDNSCAYSGYGGASGGNGGNAGPGPTAGSAGVTIASTVADPATLFLP